MSPFFASFCLVYRYGDLEQEAKDLGVGKELEVMCLFNKLYPFAIDDVTTLPFVQVCSTHDGSKSLYKINQFAFSQRTSCFKMVSATDF